MKKKKVSVVLPCLNESKNLPLLIPEIVKNIPTKYSYEIICVDDGSLDKTALVIETLAQKNKKVKGIILHKRFGHQMALYAGIKNAKGDAVITMDSDFQHPPDIIKKFINYWEKGHDLVQAQKKNDKAASWMKKIERKIGYYIWEKNTGGIISPGTSDFRLIDRQIVNYIIKSNEKEIFLRGLVRLAANNIKVVKYSVGKRKYGKSSYSMKMFVNMFINGFISFSTRPLRIASIFGLFLSIVTGFLLIYDIVSALLVGRKIIEGWVSVVFIMLILNGFIIFYLGIIGEYIGVIFRETKGRPMYIIKKTINL